MNDTVASFIQFTKSNWSPRWRKIPSGCASSLFSCATVCKVTTVAPINIRAVPLNCLCFHSNFVLRIKLDSCAQTSILSLPKSTCAGSTRLKSTPHLNTAQSNKTSLDSRSLLPSSNQPLFSNFSNRSQLITNYLRPWRDVFVLFFDTPLVQRNK